MKENTDILDDLAATTPQQERDAKTGQFLPGNGVSPGLGRGASGRTKALRVLDAILAKEENQERLGEALQREFEKNPVRFFKNFVIPLLPREARMEMEAAGAVIWTRISEAFPPTAEKE